VRADLPAGAERVAAEDVSGGGAERVKKEDHSDQEGLDSTGSESDLGGDSTPGPAGRGTPVSTGER